MESSPFWHKTENKRLSDWRPVEVSIIDGQAADGPQNQQLQGLQGLQEASEAAVQLAEGP